MVNDGMVNKDKLSESLKKRNKVNENKKRDKGKKHLKKSDLREFSRKCTEVKRKNLVRMKAINRLAR